MDISVELRRRCLLVAALATSALASALLPALAIAQVRVDKPRTALVIGNADYSFARLRNPVIDARMVASALKATGFDVLFVENAGLIRMLEAMKDFIARSRDSDVRLLFYAGHGVQANGKNYLVPVDLEMIEDSRRDAQLVNVTDLVDKLGSLRTGVNIVVLDACRSGFSGNVRGRPGSPARSMPPGLAQMVAPRGTLIAFSTGPGELALDDSAYARYLAETMRQPGLLVEQLFKRVRILVAQETGQKQIPWETSSLMGDFCFLSDNSGACSNGATAIEAKTSQ